MWFQQDCGHPHSYKLSNYSIDKNENLHYNIDFGHSIGNENSRMDYRLGEIIAAGKQIKSVEIVYIWENL